MYRLIVQGLVYYLSTVCELNYLNKMTWGNTLCVCTNSAC